MGIGIPRDLIRAWTFWNLEGSSLDSERFFFFFRSRMPADGERSTKQPLGQLSPSSVNVCHARMGKMAAG